MTPTQQMQTSKIMHGWLPVRHMQAHITGSTQCPGCHCPDETFEHLFRCKNKKLHKTRIELVGALRTKLLCTGIPWIMVEAIYNMLTEYMNGQKINIPEHQSIAVAMRSQIRVGVHLFPRGFLTVAWVQALEDLSIPHPERKAAILLKSLWMELVDKLWRCRNNIAHDKQNLTRKADDETLATRLIWFLENTQVISPGDQFLLQYTADDIQKMTGFTRRRLVTNLETVQATYTMEQQHRERGQRVITSYFQRRQDSH